MKNFLLFVLLLFFINNTSFSQLNKIKTDDFDIVTLSFGHAYVLNHAIRCAHNALNFHRELFDYEPREKISVMIQDFGDYGNGGATSIPRNLVTTCISPMNYAFESSVAGERVFSIMNHELVHITALDNASKSDIFYQKLFAGKVRNTNDHPISMFYSYLTSPRYYSPRWLHEGIAVFVETWMDAGTGNAMGNYDEMFFRTRVFENARIYSAQGLESEGTSADFMSKANSYYYGTRFMSYLAHEYGPKDLIEWIKRKDGSKRGFASNFKHVFGIKISDSWNNWIEFEKKFQNKNIQNLKSIPITEDEPITDKVLGGVSYAFHDKKRDKIYVGVNYPGKIPHIAELDLKTGKIERLKDVKGPALFNVTSLAYDEENDLLFYTTDHSSMRDLNSYNLKTGVSKLLQKNSRIGDLAFNKVDKSLWGVRHLNGYNTIVKIPKFNSDSPNDYYVNWEQKYTLDYGSDVFDIDVSPDGLSLSAAVADYFGNQYLNIYDIKSFDSGDKDNIVFKEVFDFDVASPQSFRYTDDGKYLIGSSYYSGVSNIYRVDVNTFDINILTNAITGYFRPIQINEEKMFSFRYTSEGFLPVYIPNKAVENVELIEFLGNNTIKKYPELADWQKDIPTSKTFENDKINTEEGYYVARKEMKLNYAYPILIGYKNNLGVGYKFNFEDPFSFKSLDFSISFTPNQWKNGINDTGEEIDKSEQFHSSFNYSTTKFSGFLSGNYDFYASYNKANFYDLFGPTKRSRKGLNFGVDYNQSLIYDSPKYLDIDFGIGAYYGLDQSPEFQQINFGEDYNTNLFYDVYTSLTYTEIKRSVGAVDGEKGIKSSLNVSSSITDGNFFPRLNGSLDLGFQLPINHTSLWLRNSFGNSFSDKINPFTRFGFASFGNNYIDYTSSKMYRSTFSFPGVSYDSGKALIAKSFFKSTVELVLPALRYRKLGFFNFFATYSHPSIFAGVLFSNDYNGTTDVERKESFSNIGFQIDTKLVMFSHLSSTLSFGWARAFDNNIDNKYYDEWMISLKF
jgi:hypothetical protein